MSEYDDLLGRGEYRERSRDEARADLAAANARADENARIGIDWCERLGKAGEENAALCERITELDRKVAREMERANEYRDMMHAVMDPLTWAEYHAERCGAVEGAQQMKAERDRLQARIDKALALADEWEADEYPWEWELKDRIKAVRAALAVDTPTTATAEGSDQ